MKLQERLIKVQLAHISMSYLKFRHVPELIHSVHQGINPLSKALSSLFFAKSPFGAIPPIFCLFVTPPLLEIGEPP